MKKSTMARRASLVAGILLLSRFCAVGPTLGADTDPIKCANWVYAGDKSSVCFSPKFLETTSKETNIDAATEFTPAPLASDQIFDYPFAIMTGEGAFTLLEQERVNLKAYLARGGFLMASAGCSSKSWAQSFEAEMKKIFPERPMKKIPMDHPMFRTVYGIPAIRLKKGETTQLQGLEINGRVVLVYSSEGLNDTSNVKGCCCCGGNEIKNSKEINVNVFAYAVIH